VWALSQQFHFPYALEGTDETDSELVVAADPFSAHAEAFRELRSQIMFEGPAPRRAVAVVSPDHGDGRSYVAANLAVAFSQLGGRTLLVDADMRSPRQHKLFRVEPDGGLSGILVGRAGPRSIQPVPTLPSLFVLLVGTQPPNPLELVQRATFSALIQQLEAKFDHVVIDTPAAAVGADWRVIAGSCGSALILGRRNKTKMSTLDRLVASLKKGQIRVSGVVLNEF
jgi:protein-tyrosine kinase